MSHSYQELGNRKKKKNSVIRGRKKILCFIIFFDLNYRVIKITFF